MLKLLWEQRLEALSASVHIIVGVGGWNECDKKGRGGGRGRSITSRVSFSFVLTIALYTPQFTGLFLITQSVMLVI